MIQTSTTAIEVQYTSDTPELDDPLKTRIEERLQKLVKRHHDVTGVAVAVRSPRHVGRDFKVRLVLTRRPENIVAVTEAASLQAAVKDGLDAIERQVREHRSRQHARTRRRHP